MSTLNRCQIIIFLVIVTEVIVDAQYRDNPCNHVEKGVPGVCKELEDCPDAKQDLNESIRPQNCGFEGTIAIVCCPLAAPTTAIKTTEPQIDESSVGKKSRQACESYKDLAFTRMRSAILLIDAEEEENDECPWGKGLTVVYYGNETVPAEYPHMALLGYGTWPDNYKWACGGSLISEKYVLTAAHCVHYRPYGDVQFVRLGDLDYANPDDDEHLQQINVKNRIKHPDYRSSKHYDDIALLELEREAKLSIYVKPICLYTWDPNGKVNTAIVTGWGETEEGKPSTKLLKGAVQYFPPNNCSYAYEDRKRKLTRNIDKDTQICFGPLLNATDSCQGDSGGPIQILHDKVPCSYYIFGVTSFGQGCANKGIPGVYVNLYNYIKWIEEIVWP